MAKVRVYLKDIKSVPGYEEIERGNCLETGLNNRVLSCRVGQDVFHRKIERIDWGNDIYVPFMYGETNNLDIIALHDPSLKDG